MNFILRMLVAAVALASGTSVNAGTPFVQGQAGASCHPTNQFPIAKYVYDGRALRNTGTDLGDLFIVSCAISMYHPHSHEAREYRVVFSDPNQFDANCRVYDARGEEVDVRFADWERLGYGIAWGPLSPDFYAEFTLECTLMPGASLERIEVIFDAV